MTQVINRRGESVALNIARIREVCEWGCENLDSDPLRLEASLKEKLIDGVTTKAIQENLINNAASFASVEEPDWKYTAARLLLWGKYKDRLIEDGLIYDDYYKSVLGFIDRGTYSKVILDNYSEKDLKEAGTWIDPDRDLLFDYAGMILMFKRYLRPFELPQELFLTVALFAAIPEPADKRLAVARSFYFCLSNHYISAATPIMANLRLPNGSVSSCFITAPSDDLESIMDSVTNTARISKNGGGVGINFSRVRPVNAPVMKRENSSGGVIPFIKIINDTALAVNQGGRRAGAVTVGLDVWHRDLPEFLEMQSEHGDQRRKAYDIFPQIVVNDLFMERVEQSGAWTLFDGYEIEQKFGYSLADLYGKEFEKFYKQLETSQDIERKQVFSARDIIKKIMKACIETGKPYIAFKDTINRANPNKNLGIIPGVNLCCESFSVVRPNTFSHCCNLCSINLASLAKNSDSLGYISRIAVNFLDNCIELTEPPFEQAKTHNQYFRTIGVGLMGLADFLAYNNLQYGTDETLKVVETIAEEIYLNCVEASIQLAKKRGVFEKYHKSEYSKSLINCKNLDWYINNSTSSDLKNRWVNAFEDLKLYGIRNSHLTAIAPNTSTSLTQNATASQLPTYTKFFFDKWSNGFVPITPRFIKDKFWFYQENIRLDQQKIIDVTSRIQKWNDTGISMELVFNLNPEESEVEFTAPYFLDTILYAWKKGIKAIYYTRTVQKDDYNKPDCSSCSN